MKRTLCLLALLAVAGPPAAQAAFPDPPSPYTHVAIVSQGPWDDPATWQKAPGVTVPIPGDGAVVHIPAGRRVTVRRQETARVRFVRIDGEMRLWIHSSTRLLVETIYVGPYDPGQPKTGIFRIGSGCCPVKPGRTAEIVFISDGVHPKARSAWDPKQLSRGFVSDGQVRLFGQPKTHLVAVDPDTSPDSTLDPLAGDVALTVETAPAGWKDGDEVVLTGTTFRRGQPPRDEVRRLDGDVTGTTVAFNTALAHDHVLPGRGVHPEPRLHLAHLTRNLVFASEDASEPWRRGHVMFRNGDVVIDHVRFEGLGRTDKTLPVDEVEVDVGPGGYSVALAEPGTFSNPRGRYAVHFHKNGIQPGSPAPSRVNGSVVVDTAGWGYVNHSSHVDFSDNVAYDFAGAGFVTEAGDELGSFTDNAAIRGTGNGEYRLIRTVFKNAARPQPLGDFAFQGEGFWFQGPAITVRDNVANGCNGPGMIFFTTGAAETFEDASGATVNRYVGFPRGAVNAVYAGSATPTPDPSKLRHWDYDPDRLVVADLPILDLEGFHGYGNFVGFKLRFVNDDGVDLYKEDPFDYDLDIQSPPAVTRSRQRVEGLVLWNNEQAFRMRYVERTDLADAVAINRLDYEGAAGNATTRGLAGAEYNFQILDSSLEDLTFDGYPLAAWIENRGEAVRNQFTVHDAPTLSRYAENDTWNKAAPGGYPTCSLTCAVPTGLSAQPGGGSGTTLSWSGGAIDDRYLVRYRANGAQQWEMVDTTSTSVTVDLEPNTAYTFHVVAGCSTLRTCPHESPGQPPLTLDLEAISTWSAGRSFQN